MYDTIIQRITYFVDKYTIINNTYTYSIPIKFNNTIHFYNWIFSEKNGSNTGNLDIIKNTKYWDGIYIGLIIIKVISLKL